MKLPASAKWIGLALLGLAVAIGVAIAASHLTSQQIGIASESITAGDKLAPAVRTAGAGKGNPHGGHGSTDPTAQPTAPNTTTTTEAVPPPTTVPAPPATAPSQPTESGDDHGGEGGHSGGGHGGDD